VSDADEQRTQPKRHAVEQLEPPYDRPQRSLAGKWVGKFRDAADGLVHGVCTQESLWVHIGFTAAVIAVAAGLRVELWRWAMLIVCIAMVVAAELFNTAIEQLVRTLHPFENASIALVLHLAAAAVLVTAIGAVTVGMIVFVPPLWDLLSG
jgi:diacylglycerol kinase